MYAGADGELGAALRYLNQRYTMPMPELKATLTDIGVEELNHIEMIGAILALVFELGMIFCCFFFGEGLLKIFISSSNEEVVKAGVTMYRWFGVGALVMTIVAAAMGFLFHWKRFWVYMLTHLASLVIAGILLILGAFAFKSPMPVALGYGALQAGLYLLAAVGFNVKGGKTTEMEEINHA